MKDKQMNPYPEWYGFCLFNRLWNAEGSTNLCSENNHRDDDRDLQDHKQRNEDLKIPVLCLVVKNTHSKKRADPAEAECGHQQRFFGYAPRTAFGFPFIDAVHAEGNKGNHQNGEGRELPNGENGLADIDNGLHMEAPLVFAIMKICIIQYNISFHYRQGN